MTFFELRQALGLTQVQVAQMMDYTSRQVQNWDYGKCEVPKPVMTLLEQKLEGKK